MKYIIQHPISLKYFEHDFAGWSWYEDIKGAYKFKTIKDAEEALAWLKGNQEECVIVEID